jgi:hypothetical protein
VVAVAAGRVPPRAEPDSASESAAAAATRTGGPGGGGGPEPGRGCWGPAGGRGDVMDLRNLVSPTPHL